MLTNLNSSASSIDSLHMGERNLNPPSSPVVSRTAPQALGGGHHATQQVKRLRAPSAEEVLYGGISAKAEYLVSAERLPANPTQKDCLSDSLSKLASTQFFDEMGVSGILAVETIAHTTPKAPSERQSPPTLCTVMGVGGGPSVSGQASPDARMQLSPSGGGADGVTVAPAATSALMVAGTSDAVTPYVGRASFNAEVGSSLCPTNLLCGERDRSEQRVSRKGFSIPPPMPAISPELVESSARCSNTAPNIKKHQAGPPLWPPDGSAPRQRPQENFGPTPPIRMLPLSLPKLNNYDMRGGIPVTRLLEEEGRGIVAEEAIFWRRRCEELERTVSLFKKQAAGITPPSPVAHPTEKTGAWRSEENAFGRGRSAQPRTRLFASASPSPAPDSAGKGRLSSAAPLNCHCIHQTPPSRSTSMALHSVSPQSPAAPDFLAAFGTCDGEEGCDTGALGNGPRLRGSLLPRSIVCSPEETASAEQKPSVSTMAMTVEVGACEGNDSPGAIAALVVEDADALYFDSESVIPRGPTPLASSGGQRGAPESDAPVTTGDNLRLVLVEREAHELKRQLDRAREDVDALSVSSGRYRLRCDELETQSLTLEEKLNSQRDRLEQRIRELEDALSKATDMGNGSPQGQLTGADVGRMEAALVPLMSMLSSDAASQERREEAITSIAGVLDTVRKCAVVTSSTTADSQTGLQAPAPPSFAVALSDWEEVRALIRLVASVADPVNGESSAAAEVPPEGDMGALVAVAKKYAGLAQEMADTQAIHIAELREELEVVRRDRNELIGEQGERVRQLQQELLVQETAHVALLEKVEAVEAEREQLRHERDTLQARLEESHAGQQVQADEAASGLDADAFERRLRSEFEEEKRKACEELERKLRDAHTGAEAARRAQHSVFTERLAAVQGQLRDVRVVTSEERDGYKAEIDHLTRELQSAKSALEAKEVALSIALREDVPRGDRRRHTPPAAALAADAAPSAPALLLTGGPTTRGRSSDPFEPAKLASTQRASSLSFASHGLSMGESTAATRPVGSERRLSAEGLPDTVRRRKTVSPAAMRVLERSGWTEGVGDGGGVGVVGGGDSGPSTRTRSPSPILGVSAAGSGLLDHTRSGSLDSAPSPGRTTAAMMDRALVGLGLHSSPRRMPARQAPDPTSPLEESRGRVGDAVASGSGPPQAEAATRHVTFVGVPAQAPSPAASARDSPTPPLPMPSLDTSGWARPVSRSVSSSLAGSPNTAFLREGERGLVSFSSGSPRPLWQLPEELVLDDHVGFAAAARTAPEKENDVHRRSTSPLQSSLSRLTRRPSSSPLDGRAPDAPSPLQQRGESMTNSSISGGGGGSDGGNERGRGARRRFVKMGSLQRMREVWARQESLLLGSPSSPSRGRE